MTVYRNYCALLLVALLGCAGGIQAQENPFTPEQMAEAQSIGQKQLSRKLNAPSPREKLFAKSTPIVITVKDSLSLQGYGVPGGYHFGLASVELQCQNGVLYYADAMDFDQRYLGFAFDSTRTFAQAAKEELDQLAPYLAMKSMTPALHQRLQAQMDALHQAHTPADLMYIQSIAQYGLMLTGANAMTPGQLSKFSAYFAHRQQLIEDLQKLVAAREKAPKDAALEAKVVKAFDQFIETQNTDTFGADFFTANQLAAMGMARDADAKSNGRAHHSVSVSASASAGAGAGAGDPEAEMAKYEAEEKARQKHNRDAAQLKFALKGRDAATTSISIQCATGTLWVYSDAQFDNTAANFTFYFDETVTWAKQRDDLKKNYDASKPNDAAELERMAQATSQPAYIWGFAIKALKEKTHAVPEDVQQRLDAMVKEWDTATAALMKCYQQSLAKPTDTALQRQLFEAARTAYRVDRKNSMLTQREAYDEEGVRDELPWLMTLEQADAATAGTLVTGSEMTSGTGGTISVSARPAGDKQYVAINASNFTVGDLAKRVEHSAQKYYHNHKLKLSVDAAASDKPLKGVVEGKSPEELFKSFAQRAGLSVVKDEKNPDGYVLKL